jgi:molybdate transport system substrate-binding protein
MKALFAATRYLLALATGLLVGCVAKPAALPGPPTVVIAVAADLQYAFEEIMLDFHRVHPDVVVRPAYGSSGSLFSQISNHAPFDMFLAADVDYVRRLADADILDRNSIFMHGQSQLVVWIRQDSPLPIEQEGINVVLDPRVRKLTIADPKHSPYGHAAKQSLQTLELYEQVASKLVLGENVAQSAHFVESGAADVGIIAKTLALSPPLRAVGKFAEVPKDAFRTMMQGGGIITRAKDPAACKILRNYILSPRGKTILSEYGLLPPKEG